MARAIPVDAFISGLTDSSGNVLASGKVYTYTAGTTTPKSTWQDNAQSSAHANPVVLDSQGKKLVFAYGNYKFVIKDSSDNTLYTHDNLWFGSEDEPLYHVGTTAGSSNAYTGSTAVGIGTSLVTGMRIRCIANFANTSAATFNLNSLGAVAIRTRRSSSVALGANAIQSGEVFELMYDGTVWRLMSGEEGWNTWTPTPTPGGSLTLSSTSIQIANYRIFGGECEIEIAFTGIQGGSAADNIVFTLPVTPASASTTKYFHTLINDNSTYSVGHIMVLSASANAQIRKGNLGNFAASGTFECSGRATFKL